MYIEKIKEPGPFPREERQLTSFISNKELTQ